MSSQVGSPSGFVDTQDVTLDNLTDSLIYLQAQTVLPFEVGHSMAEHHTCTGYVEKLPSLDNVSLDITAILTEPELPALMTLSLVSSLKLPIKQWRVTYSSFGNLSAAVTGFAKMFNFKILDKGNDLVKVSFRLEFESNIAGSDADVVSVV